MRAHMLQAFVLLGETGRVERFLANMGAGEREGGEMRNAIALLRLARHDPLGAAAVLAPVLDGSVWGHPVWVVAAALLEAIARDELGDPAAAGRAMERALDLAEPDLMLFPFLIHPVPALLERHARDCARHAALVAEILGLLPGGHRGSGRMASPGRGVVLEGRLPANRAVPPAGRAAEPGRDPGAAVSADQLVGSGDRPELSVSVHGPDAHPSRVRQAGRARPHGRTEAVTQAHALGLLAPSPRAP